MKQKTRHKILAQLLAALVLIAAMMAMNSCERQITSREPDISVPDLAVPSNVQATLGNQTITLSWQVSSSSGISRYRVYTASTETGSYLLRDSSNGTTVTLSGLPLNQPLFVRIAAVNASGIEGVRSVAKQVTVAPFSIVLNNDDRTTRNRTVNAVLTAPTTTSSVQLSEDAAFTGSPSLAFTTSKSFALSTGDGPKTVYARFTLSDGSVTSSSISDQIIYDTRATISSLSFAPLATIFDVGDEIIFTMQAGEINGTATVEVVGLGNFSLFDDGRVSGDVSGDGIYLGNFIVPVNTFVTNAPLKGTFRDEAGNEAVEITATQFITIATAPIPVTLATIEAESNFKANLSWNAAAAENYNSYRLYRRTTLPIATTNSTLVETSSARTTTTFSDTTLTPGTKYYYRVFVFNSAGMSSGSNVDSVSMPANTAPTAVSLAGAFTDSNNVRLTWTLNSEPDFLTYQIYRRTTPGVTTADQLVTILNARSTDTFTDFVNANTVYYRIFVFDRHGLSTGSNEITVITQ